MSKLDDTKNKIKGAVEKAKQTSGYKKLKRAREKTKGKKNILPIVAVCAIVGLPITLISCHNKFQNELFSPYFKNQSEQENEMQQTDEEGIVIAQSTSDETATPTVMPVVTMNSNTDSTESTVSTPKMTVTFLHTTGGNCTYIESNTMSMLIDTGESDDYNYISNFLKARNNKKLDYLLLTSIDDDTAGAADNIINDFDVSNLVIQKISRSSNEINNVIIQSARNTQTPIIYPKAGRQFAIGYANALILSPVDNEESTYNSDNLIVRVSCDDVSFFFSGDTLSKKFIPMISWANQEEIDISSTVMVCSDHGSSSGYSQQLYDVVKPSICIIDQTEGNRYPDNSVVTKIQESDAELYRMSKLDNGVNLRFITDGVKIQKID